MKKKILVVVVVLVLIGAFIVFITPTPMELKTQGVRVYIQEDVENTDMEVSLKFTGAVSDLLVFGQTFVGELMIDDAVFYGVEFQLGKEALLFGELESGDPVYIGEIYTDEAFKQVSIISKELGDEGQALGNGIVITGPAVDREEGLEITKELLQLTDSKNLELFD